ncbi:hypothetical protein CCACVL1_29130 [Corchorus capsularis]|uniref:Uncharacterized protein n=1 Tax=Corchorus capsularis TaxID=210143 RepID=A0A1R3G3L3_COCAP|nr:hypothetical protein CCACVL1_29130 [Corchorus capsularis]
MGPANHTSSSNKLMNISSPLPYLFGSLAVVFILIALALIMLACSYRKYSSNSSSRRQIQLKQEREINNMGFDDSEPKIVVIMAGDDKPTFLAKPAASSSTCCSEQV